MTPPRYYFAFYPNHHLSIHKGVPVLRFVQADYFETHGHLDDRRVTEAAHYLSSWWERIMDATYTYSGTVDEALGELIELGFESPEHFQRFVDPTWVDPRPIPPPAKRSPEPITPKSVSALCEEVADYLQAAFPENVWVVMPIYAREDTVRYGPTLHIEVCTPYLPSQMSPEATRLNLNFFHHTIGLHDLHTGIDAIRTWIPCVASRFRDIVKEKP